MVIVEPGVESCDSWARGSREKHTTHLSSTQEELKSKVVDRQQTETDGPYCTSHPHLRCHGDGPGVSTYQVTALPRQATSPTPYPPAVFQKPTGQSAPKSFGFSRRVWRVWQKQGCRP